MRYRIVTIAVILVSALMLCSAGFYNRYALLYPDSIEYIKVGKTIWNYLRSGTPGWFGQRSPFYSLFVYLLYQEHSLWGVILGQSLILSYLIWLSFRKIIPKFCGLYFLTIIILLTLFTSVSWYTSFVTPDIFAAILILGIFNLGFGSDTSNTFQFGSVIAFVILAITVHTSHLILTPVLFIGVIVIHLILQTPFRLRITAIVRLLATIAASIAIMLASTYFLYGKLGLVGPHPPFLLARVIGDGTGKLYLKEYCIQRDYAICKYIDILPKTSQQFLWGKTRVSWNDDLRKMYKESERKNYALYSR